jgi:hypothetical protein
MSETKAMTTTAAVPPKTEALAHVGGTSYVTRQAARAVTPAPSVAQSMASVFQKGPHVTDPIKSGPLAGLSRSLIDTFKDTVAKGANDNELYLFVSQAIELNLDPRKKEIWCVNMAGQGKPAQWMIAPSRDGYVKMIQRHPNFKSIISKEVYEADTYSMDAVSGRVTHHWSGMKGRGALLGAWCKIETHDGQVFVAEALLSQVRRPTGVWDQHTAKMVLKCAQHDCARKSGLASNIYINDRVWQSIDAIEAEALLVDPTQQAYVDGFVVGTEPAELPAGATSVEPTGPSRASRADGVTALKNRIAAIQETVKDATWGDAVDARNAWLTAIGHPPLSKIEDPQVVWDLVDLLESEDASDHFTQLVTAAREARWKAEARAKEYAEAGQQPPATTAVAEPAIDVEVVDEDDIPTFDGRGSGQEIV